VSIEQPEVDPKRETITDQLIVMCENVCQPGNSQWEVAGFGRAEIVEEKTSSVKLIRLVHYKGENNMKELSIVIPAYNEEKYRLGALDAARYLEHVHYEWEVIIVDGSTDLTKRLLADFVKKIKDLKYF
jgi:hypothetical protein